MNPSIGLGVKEQRTDIDTLAECIAAAAPMLVTCAAALAQEGWNPLADLACIAAVANNLSNPVSANLLDTWSLPNDSNTAKTNMNFLFFNHTACRMQGMPLSETPSSFTGTGEQG